MPSGMLLSAILGVLCVVAFNAALYINLRGEIMNYEKLVRGTELSADDQKHVLRAYVHRFTGEHKPQWAMKDRPGGGAYPPQFKDDADWLAHTEFQITGLGTLDMRVNRCHSTPTWPGQRDISSPA